MFYLLLFIYSRAAISCRADILFTIFVSIKILSRSRANYILSRNPNSFVKSSSRLVILSLFSQFSFSKISYLLYIYIFLFFKKLSVTLSTYSFLQYCCDSNLYSLYSLSEEVLSVFAVEELCEVHTSWEKV